MYKTQDLYCLLYKVVVVRPLHLSTLESESRSVGQSHSMSLVKLGEEEEEQTMVEMTCQHWPKLKAEFLGPLSQKKYILRWRKLTGQYTSGGRRGTRRWEFRRGSFMLYVSFVMLEISYIKCVKFTLDNEGGTFWLHNQFSGFIFLQWKCCFLSFWPW